MFNKKNRFLNNILEIWRVFGCSDNVSCKWGWSVFHPSSVGIFYTPQNIHQSDDVLIFQNGEHSGNIDYYRIFAGYKGEKIEPNFPANSSIEFEDNGVFLSKKYEAGTTYFYYSHDFINWHDAGSVPYVAYIRASHGNDILIDGNNLFSWKLFEQNTWENWTQGEFLHEGRLYKTPSHITASSDGFVAVCETELSENSSNAEKNTAVIFSDGNSPWIVKTNIPHFGDTAQYNFATGIKKLGENIYFENAGYLTEYSNYYTELIKINEDFTTEITNLISFQEIGCLNYANYVENTNEIVLFTFDVNLQHFMKFISADGLTFVGNYNDESSMGDLGVYQVDKIYYQKNMGFIAHQPNSLTTGELIFLPYY